MYRLASNARCRRVAQKRFPDDVLRRHIRVYRSRPLRLAVRRIAVHVGVDRGDLPHQLRLQERQRVRNVPGGGPLVPDLHGAPVAGALCLGGRILLACSTVNAMVFSW